MKRTLAGFALAGMMLLAVPAEKAQAVSLINPAGAATTQFASEGLVIDVRRGGHGGGFRGARMGRMHFGGPRHFGFRHRHWRGPRVYFGGPVVTYPRRCRWVMTYNGPVRVCRRPIWW